MDAGGGQQEQPTKRKRSDEGEGEGQEGEEKEVREEGKAEREGEEPQPDLEVRLRLAESELRLRREQEEALRARLGEAALWAAEAARALGGERRRGEVKGAAVATLEAQLGAAREAADGLRVRLDAACAQRDAHARAAALRDDEVAQLKQQLLRHGQHLSCQLDLENAAVKYQGKIKEYLLTICRNVKMLEEEQEMLKQSVTKVSTISLKMEKGLNHYSCKEKMWLEERRTLEKKVVELGAEVESVKIQSRTTTAERSKYYESIISDLQLNLKNEIEKNAKLLKKIECIQRTEMNYEQRIEELIHQVHEKKEKIDLLEKEKADLHNKLKHNEREMEILERKHKYELDYALQKPLAFSCETQTDDLKEDNAHFQANSSGCALCRARAQNISQQKRRGRESASPNTIQPSILSIPLSQNTEGHGFEPYFSHYNKPFMPYYTVPSTDLHGRIEPISLDSLGPVDESENVQWYTRRNDLEENVPQRSTVINQNTATCSLTINNGRNSPPIDEYNQALRNTILHETQITTENEDKKEKESSVPENVESCHQKHDENEIAAPTRPLDIKTQFPAVVPENEYQSQTTSKSNEKLATFSEVSQNITVDENVNRNPSNALLSENTSIHTTIVSSVQDSNVDTPENTDKQLHQSTKFKRRVLKVLH
ncbi:hypothetical protein R5R35_007446 [Gryllus longicercus]|uniref:Uncharacterized protein n=1 Tax=Gryllus longicercus TaxID=2509291 RepID=A0AAN9VBH0_9ORTH